MAFLAYSNSFSAPFLLDDFGSIVNNRSIRQAWSLAIFQPPPDVGTGGRPLVNASFALNYAFGGVQVATYHLTNLGIHIATGFLLFGVVRRTLQRCRTSVSPSPPATLHSPDDSSLPALMIAGLWIAHPLLATSVTYISQRTELLMALCYVATLYAFIRASAGRSERTGLVASVIFCGLGMAAKEVMVTAPLMVLLYDRTFVSGTFRTALMRRPRYYLALAASWLVLALLMRGLQSRHVGLGLGVSPWHNLLTQCEAIVTYAKLAWWPTPLIFDYGPTFTTTLREAMPFAVPLILAIAGTIFLFVRHPRIGFCPAAFLLMLAPTSSVIPVVLQPIAENRVYLPLAALIAFFVLPVFFLLGRRSVIPFAAVGLAAIGLTVARNAVFAHADVLNIDTILKRPLNPRAHESQAHLLALQGKPAEALPYLQRALELNPRSSTTLTMLGDNLMALGQLPEAQSRFEQAIALEPKIISARINLGVLLFRAQRFADAMPHFQEVLRLNPRDVVAHRHLGLCLDRLGHSTEAEVHFRTAQQLEPNDAMIHFDYAMLLVRTEQWSRALEHFEATVRLRPDWAEARNGLGVTLFRLRQLPPAVFHLEQALRLKPDYAEARQNLAVVRAALPDAK